MSAPKVGRRPQLSRADLARALHLSREEGEQEPLGVTLGFGRESARGGAEPRHSPRGRDLDTAGGEELPAPEVMEPVEAAELPFWRLETAEFTAWAEDEPPLQRDPQDSGLEPLTREDFGRVVGAPRPPRPPPLSPWPRLRRFVESLRRRPRAIGDIDVDALVVEIGRGRPIERLPRELRRARVPKLVLVMDRSDRLIPFWGDQVRLWRRIAREFGGEGLSISPLEGGPPGDSGSEQAMFDALTPGLAEGDAVLVLGDLGLLDPTARAEQRRWAQLGRVLRERGVTGAALLPCPAARWPREIVRPWLAADWSAPMQRSRGQGLDEVEREQRRDDLLALLSWVVRLEPELLREVRASLPQTLADVGTEADAWNHPDLRRHPTGLMFSAAHRQRYQENLRTLVSDVDGSNWSLRFAEVVAIVRRRHECGPQENWQEELRTLDMLDLGRFAERDELERAREFAARTRLTIDGSYDPGSGVSLHAWGRRGVDTRVPRSGWDHPDYGDDLVALWSRLHEGDASSELPEGLSPARLAELRVPRGRTLWRVDLRRGELRLEPEGAMRKGSPVATLVARTPEVLTSGPGLRRILHALESVDSRSLTLPAGDEFELSTDCEKLSLRRVTCPTWAEGMGRDEHGLWASFRVGEVEQRMRWIPPGRVATADGESELDEGYWLAEQPCSADGWRALFGDPGDELRGTGPTHSGVEGRTSSWGGAEGSSLGASWTYARRCLVQLEAWCPGLSCRLPREVEYEHAFGSEGKGHGLNRGPADQWEWCDSPRQDESKALTILFVGERSDDAGLVPIMAVGHELMKAGTGVGVSTAWSELVKMSERLTPRVVHIHAHGGIGLQLASGRMVEADEVRSIGERLAVAGVECVVLDASRAPHVEVLREFVSYVIGFEGAAHEDEVARFCRELYRSLGRTRSVERAFDEALSVGAEIEARLWHGQHVRALRGGAGMELAQVRTVDDRSGNASFRIAAPRETPAPPPSWADRAGYDRHGRWASVRVGEVDLRMRWIPPGCFLMGSPEDEEGRWDREGLQHEVTLTQGYWMAETPCTQALWSAVAGSNPSDYEGAQRPVENVSWDDTQSFLARLSEQTEPGWVLPTEAQWEYACRAGTTGPRHGDVDEVAWHHGNSGGETHEVGLKLANPWGLHDMLGNVEEWCADHWGSYEAGAVVDPGGPDSGSERVARGGCWGVHARDVRAAVRRGDAPGRRGHWLGFRLVRGQGLRQASERSENQRVNETSKGGKAGAGDPPSSRPAPPQGEDGR